MVVESSPLAKMSIHLQLFNEDAPICTSIVCRVASSKKIKTKIWPKLCFENAKYPNKTFLK